MGELLIAPCELPPSGEEVDEWYELEQPTTISQGVSGELRLQLRVERASSPWEVTPLDVKELGLDVAKALNEQRGGGRHGLMDGKSVKLGKPKGDGRLKLRVVGAVGLPARDDPKKGQKATSDPFAEVFLEDSYVRTSTVKKNCSPEWPDGPQVRTP